jgi:hypothetical protein
MLLQDAHSMAEEGKRAALPGPYSGLEVDGPPRSLPAGQHPPTSLVHCSSACQAHAHNLSFCLFHLVNLGSVDGLRKGLNPRHACVQSV